jgi:outer membrane efflux protein
MGRTRVSPQTDANTGLRSLQREAHAPRPVRRCERNHMNIELPAIFGSKRRFARGMHHWLRGERLRDGESRDPKRSPEHLLPVAEQFETGPAVRGRQHHATRPGYQSQAVDAANTALRLSIDRYEAGIVTHLEVSSTETAALQAELSAIDIRTRRINGTVMLVKALGGGWR